MKLTIESKLPRRHEYTVMFWVGVLIFILSNQYFGWNRGAESGAEGVFDFIWFALIFLGGFGMIVRSLIEEAHQDLIYSAEIEKDKSL